MRRLLDQHVGYLVTLPDASISFIFSTLRARVSFFLAPEYQHDELLLVRERQDVQLLGQLRAQRLLQWDGNPNLPLFGVRLKCDGHEIRCLYTCASTRIGIDDHVLNPTPVSDCAAPSVAIDGHLDASEATVLGTCERRALAY